MPTFSVDLNCDIGESFGTYQIGNDKAILDYVTSANIACGFHAGDPSVMKKTVKLALEKGVAIGAHPGLADLAGFGRRAMAISPEEAYDLLIYQLGALYGFVHSEGGQLHHVKPHGALYNMAAVNPELAESIAEAVYKFNPELILYGLAGSQLIFAAKKLGLTTASEVFADRTYQDDGTLSPRQLPNALIKNKEQAIKQIIQIIKEEKVISLQGTLIPMKAETICIHGDQAEAIALARELYQALKNEKIELKTSTS